MIFGLLETFLMTMSSMKEPNCTILLHLLLITLLVATNRNHLNFNWKTISELRINFGPLGIFLMTEFYEGAQLATNRNHSNFHWKNYYATGLFCNNPLWLQSPSCHQILWGFFPLDKEKLIQCLKTKSFLFEIGKKILLGQI